MLNKKFIFAFAFAAAVLGASGAQAQEELLAPAMFTPLAGQAFSSPMPVISGKAMSADAVLVFIDNVFNGEAKVSDNVFEYRPFLPLSSGDHAIRLQAKDAATGAVSDFSEERVVRIIPNPAPVILSPENDARLGQDRIWVGGVAKNGSLVRILVDGTEAARTRARDHASGTGSFSVNLSGLSLGGHTITAIARDKQGKESFASAPVSITVLPATPAPVLMRPVVNADAGIERPFVVGVAKNGLTVTIVVDGIVRQHIPLGADPSGATSFSWQPTKALSLGRHTIEAYASDRDKLSNNSAPVFWQVGEVVEPAGIMENEGGAMSNEEPTPISVLDDTETPVPPLSVREDLEPPTEEVPAIPDEPEVVADSGRVEPEEDLVAIGEIGETQEPEDNITELAPGAVVRDTPVGEESEFTFNNSLIIGIVILVFLLLSILVWYIQEKREALSERVVSMFREDEGGGKNRSDKLPGDMSAPGGAKPDVRPERDDLPPPPPPMF